MFCHFAVHVLLLVLCACTCTSAMLFKPKLCDDTDEWTAVCSALKSVLMSHTQAHCRWDVNRWHSVAYSDGCGSALHRCMLQIENIQRVIKVTRKKLEEMNEEFGKHQHPPSIYVQVRTIHLQSAHKSNTHIFCVMLSVHVLSPVGFYF